MEEGRVDRVLQRFGAEPTQGDAEYLGDVPGVREEQSPASANAGAKKSNLIIPPRWYISADSDGMGISS